MSQGGSVSSAFNRDATIRVFVSLESCCAEFLIEWQTGERPNIQSYIERIPEADRFGAFAKLLAIEVEYRRKIGEQPSSAEYTPKFAMFETEIEQVFRLAGLSSVNQGSGETTQQYVDERATMSAVANGDGNRTRTLQSGNALSSSHPPQQIGKYEVVEHLGKGGFGDVWKAIDPILNRIVAIKLLRSDRPTNSWDVDRFWEEGRKLAQLQERGARIIAIHDAGVDQAGRQFLVTQYMAGGSLDDEIDRREFTWQEATRLVAELADTLAVAHANGIYHRDVKPKNILLDGQGHAYLADFGLAASWAELEASRGRLGSPLYLSPEQAAGNSHLVDGRTDLYGLGVVFYQLLTRRLPYPSHDVAAYERMMLDPERRPIPIRELSPQTPPEVAAACLRCLETKVDDRFATVKDLANVLRQATDGSKLPTPRNVWQKVAIGLIVSILGIAIWFGAVGFFHSVQPPVERRPEPPIGNGSGVWNTNFPTPPTEEFWEGRRGVGEVKVNEDGTVLTVQGNELRLAKLGLTPAGDMEFSVDLKQIANAGEVGVFWGKHESEWAGAAATRMQAVVLHRVDRQLFVSHWGVLVLPTNGQFLAEMELGSCPLGIAADIPRTLTVELSQGYLKELSVDSAIINGIPSPEQKDRLKLDHRKGSFGVFSRGDTTLFTRPRFTTTPTRI